MAPVRLETKVIPLEWPALLVEQQHAATWKVPTLETLLVASRSRVRVVTVQEQEGHHFEAETWLLGPQEAAVSRLYPLGSRRLLVAVQCSSVGAIAEIVAAQGGSQRFR